MARTRSSSSAVGLPGSFGAETDQLVQRKAERQHHQQDRGAQEPGRAAGKGEIEPQAVAVLDMLVVEKAQPHRRADHDDNAHQPFRGEALFPERRLAVVGRAAGDQDGEHHRQNQGFLEIDAFQQRQEDTGDQPDDRQVIGGVEAPEQPVGKDQQRQSGHGVQQAGQFQHRVRQQLLQEVEAVFQRRIGTGNQQHRPRQRHQRSDDLRRQLRQPPGGAPHRLPQIGAAGEDLVAKGQEGGECQRQNEVDATIGQDAADQDRARHCGQHQYHQ